MGEQHEFHFPFIYNNKVMETFDVHYSALLNSAKNCEAININKIYLMDGNFRRDIKNLLMIAAPVLFSEIEMATVNNAKTHYEWQSKFVADIVETLKAIYK